MPRETDLLRVKLVAHTLLDVQIQKTALSPVIVSHPFTNSGISALRNEDGSLSMVDLINNSDDCTRWRRKVGEQIDSAENVHQIFVLLNPPYYLTFIKFAASALSEKDLGKLQARHHSAGIVGKNREAGSNPSRRGRQNPVLQAQDSPKDQEAFPRHGKAAMEQRQEQEKTDPCHFHPKRLLTEGRQIGEDQQSKPHPGVEHQTALRLLHVTESPPSQSACGTFPWPAGYPE